jgi:BolA family transcriptional regulator, general stress-responsive regulator
MDRVQEIRRRLTEAFSPTRLEIIDQSHLHAGHAGARATGGGHFVVTIASPGFAGKTPVQRHRMVYDVLGDLMAREIHALSLRATER